MTDKVSLQTANKEINDLCIEINRAGIKPKEVDKLAVEIGIITDQKKMLEYIKHKISIQLNGLDVDELEKVLDIVATYNEAHNESQ